MLKNMAQIRKASGFTLLEILVVLVLTGMVTTILLQGLQQVMRLQTHFGIELFNTQQGAMLTDWYRQTVDGLMPDYPDGKHKFQGEQRRFSGSTVSPLNAPNGNLVPFAWSLRFDPQRGETLLQYGTEDNAPVLMAWRGNFGGFTYFDAKGEPHDSWPPFLGQWPQLPSAIRLEAKAEGEVKLIMAAPKGPEDTLLRSKDIEKL